MSQYRDPVKARLALVDSLKPTQWAGLVSTIARNAERGGWTTAETVQVLSMLGLDRDSAKEAKQALRRSARLRVVHGHAPGPFRPRAEPSAAKPGPSWVAAPVPHGYRDRKGKFRTAEICVAGLHELVGDNRITRPDRDSVQCRACTRMRKSSPEYLARERARRLRLKERLCSDARTSSTG